jgi:hypothetical protein
VVRTHRDQGPKQENQALDNNGAQAGQKVGSDNTGDLSTRR